MEKSGNPSPEDDRGVLGGGGMTGGKRQRNSERGAGAAQWKWTGSRTCKPRREFYVSSGRIKKNNK